MKLSSFWHYIKGVDKFWHSLYFLWLDASPSLKNIFFRAAAGDLAILSEDEVRQLNDLKFLSTEEDEERIIKSFLHKKEKSEIRSLYLIMTTRCNLSCSYCLYGPIQSGSLSKKGKDLSLIEIRDALLLFRDKTQRNNRSSHDYWEQITFYGGEPLLNPKGIRLGLDLINRIKLEDRIWENIKVIVDTNGTLIDDDFINFAISNNLCVQISIDGPREIHDAARKFKNGKGTFDVVFSMMKKMSHKKMDFLPLITVSPSNVQSLPECVEWLCREFEIKEIAMNLLMYTGKDPLISYGTLAADAMIEAHNVARKFGVSDSVFKETVERFKSPEISPEICGAGVKIVAFPGGNLHACQALESCNEGLLGTIKDFDEESLNWKKWKARSRFANAKCVSCHALGFCGGGCAASAFVASGKLNDIDPYYCQWLKRLFDMWVNGQIQ